MVWRLPAQGDISQALTQHPELYTLSMGHMGDLTLSSFAYLKLPLALAAIAFAGIALGLAIWRNNIGRAVLVVAAGMVIFFQAARLALVRFDGYLGSYPLAQALMKAPPGQLVEANSYYAFSSVFFYTGRTALLLNGRNNNLEYGSYAPGAPDVFIDDASSTPLDATFALLPAGVWKRETVPGRSCRQVQPACGSRERRQLPVHQQRDSLRTMEE